MWDAGGVDRQEDVFVGVRVVQTGHEAEGRAGFCERAGRLGAHDAPRHHRLELLEIREGADDRLVLSTR